MDCIQSLWHKYFEEKNRCSAAQQKIGQCLNHRSHNVRTMCNCFKCKIHPHANSSAQREEGVTMLYLEKKLVVHRYRHKM